MKELTKEQLTEYVLNTMIMVYKENEKELLEKVDNSSDNLGALLGICITKTMQICSCMIIETLDYVLNDK